MSKLDRHARELCQRIERTVLDRFGLPQARPAPRPTPATGEQVIFGRDTSNVPFGVETKTRFEHTLVVGATGSGKSKFFIHGCRQDMLAGHGILLTDPHGAAQGSVFWSLVLDAPRYAAGRPVYVIDPNDPEFSTGFNPIGMPSDIPEDLLEDCAVTMASQMLEAIERVRGDEDTMEKPTVRRTLRGLFAVLGELRLTLTETDLFLHPDDPSGIRRWAIYATKGKIAREFLQRVERLARDPRLRSEFEIEVIGAVNRLSELLAYPRIRAMVGQIARVVDLRAAMDDGAVVLANLSGGQLVYENDCDLLGRLLTRALLFNAKRRRNHRPFMAWLDEAHRYISGDVPNLLAEVRKHKVGMTFATQFLSQLGEEGDLGREALLKVPYTRVIFRMNDQEEAEYVARNVMKLNVEMPVSVLKAPTVVAHELRHMRSASAGGNATRTNSASATKTAGTGVTQTQGETEGTSSTRTVSEQKSFAKSRGHSRSVADGEQHAHGITHSHVESESDSESDGSTFATATNRSRGGGSNEQNGTSSGASFAQSFDVPVNPWRSGEASYGRAAAWGEAGSRNVTAGYDDGRSQASGSSQNWVEGESESEAHTHQRSHSSSVADGVAESETHGTSHVVTEGENESVTHGRTHGVAVAEGVNRSRSNSIAHARQESTGITTGESAAQGENWSAGWSETMVPIMEDRDTAVHGLDKVQYLAGQALCGLPTGAAVVRTIVDGKIEGAMVKIAPVPDPSPREQAEIDQIKHRLLTASPATLPYRDAVLEIVQRRERLAQLGSPFIAPALEPSKPKEFRVRTTKVTRPRR